MSRVETHRPVLLEEALHGLNIRANGHYVDGTFGRGGHSGAILQHIYKEGRLLAFDKDPEAVATAQQRFAADERFEIENASFADMHDQIQARGWMGKVDGILLDLGVLPLSFQVLPFCLLFIFSSNFSWFCFAIHMINMTNCHIVYMTFCHMSNSHI